MKKSKGKGKGIVVDFTGVESGAGGIRVPEGDYPLQIVSTKGKKGKESEKPYIEYYFEITKGKYKGKKLRYTTSLQKQALWNLKNLIEACGNEVPSKAIRLDFTKMVGWTCAGSLIDTKFEGRTRSEIAALFPLAELGKEKEAEEPEDEGGVFGATEEEEGEEGEDETSGEVEELF